MPEYKIVDAGKLDADLKAFADAIRAKLGTQASLRFPDGMAEAISQISSSASSANVAWGSVIPTHDYYGDDESPTITHNLGVTPNFYIFAHKGGSLSTGDVRGVVVVEVGDFYIQAETVYGSKNDTINAYPVQNYADDRDETTFTVFTYNPAGNRICAGEEYIWICGVMG